jgi:hypothetical protein
MTAALRSAACVTTSLAGWRGEDWSRSGSETCLEQGPAVLGLADFRHGGKPAGQVDSAGGYGYLTLRVPVV